MTTLMFNWIDDLNGLIKLALLKPIGLLNQLILLNNFSSFIKMILLIIWIKLIHLIDFVVLLTFKKNFGFYKFKTWNHEYFMPTSIYEF